MKGKFNLRKIKKLLYGFVDDITFNLRRLKKLLLGFVDDIPFSYVSEDVMHYNRNIALIFSIFAFTLIAFMLFISFLRHEFSSSKIIYIVGVIGSCLIFLLAYVGKSKKVYVWTSVYLAEIFFLFYGLAIGLLTRADMQTTTFMVMLVLLPIIFIDRPIVTNIILLCFVIIFCIGAFFLKADNVKVVDIIDALIFGLLASISGTAVNYIRLKGFLLEQKLRVLSEIDQLTGLKNRNSYEWALPSFEGMGINKLACIYMDINGLHELNNTKGHKEGDIMLKSIAKVVQELFGIQHTYRIGGDEYVAFVFDADVDLIYITTSELEKRVSDMGYNIAIGYAKYEEGKVNIHKLIKDAEHKMYQNKKEFYRETGTQR